MKNLLPLVIVGGVGLIVGFVAGRFTSNYSINISPNQQPSETIKNPQVSTSSPQSPASISKQKASTAMDQYEIQWNGVGQLDGIYSISYPYHLKKLSRHEKVSAPLPHKMKFSEVKGTSISASSISFGSQKVEIKILRNGINCIKQMATGSAVTNDHQFCPAEEQTF